jgi:Fic family protein
MALTKPVPEPPQPEPSKSILEDLACTVIERSARLKSSVRPQFRQDFAVITRWIHCYYSNLIEDQQTSLPDIEAAIRDDFSSDPRRRDLQRLALSHLACQRWAADYVDSVFAPAFICELHRRLYSDLPQSLFASSARTGARGPMEPGILRQTDVERGADPGPAHQLVPGMLQYFRQQFDAPTLSRTGRIIAIAASHHRLAWIRPFREGNGRVIRLFSDTLVRRLGIDAGGLWSLSRGLALRRVEYERRLANADQERSSTSINDPRGNVSMRAMHEFCEFVLLAMVDQIDFMEKLLETGGLADRIQRYVHLEAGLGDAGPRIALLLKEALYRGEFPRGEAGRIAGASERTGRAALAAAVEAGLLTSLAPKSPVRLALPPKVLATYFPQLLPPENLQA